MRKKEFAFSWGRKLFFGIGWALTSLVALNYFRSMIIPQTFGGWFYYLLTYIGHYGLIISAVYFFLYCPVVSIFPSYYMSRLWSALLLLATNLLIFLDGHLFAKYRFHLNSFLFQLLKEGNGKDVLGLSSSGLVVLGVLMFLAFVVIWIRGEWTWRAMQARFSNPVKNWYLVLIFFCFVGSHLFHMYGDAKGKKNITKIAALFPLNFPLTSKGLLYSRGLVTGTPSGNQGYRDFYYPASDMSCGKSGKNIILITIVGWSPEHFNGFDTPQMWHIANHGKVFTNHFSGGTTTKEGLFSILYSLPPSYLSSAVAEGKETVLSKVLEDSKYSVLNVNLTADKEIFNNFVPWHGTDSPDYLDSYLSERSEDQKPFFVNLLMGPSMPLADKDELVKHIVDTLQVRKLVSNTILILTGSHGVSGNTSGMSIKELKTPLMVVWPDSIPGVIETYTSHYDIVPTILNEEFKCKNRISDYSFGHSLFSSEPRSLHVAGNYSELGILDFDVKTFTTIEQYGGLLVRDFNLHPYPKDKVNEARVLNVLEQLTFFFRKH